MSQDQHKAPFPWFGGKSKAAPAIWSALGDVDHYVEPFAGSIAVLLNRPHVPNRAYHSETVNDADGLLVNAWRAVQLDPDATAYHASNPVAECDLHARHLALVRWRAEGQLVHLMGDPAWCDPQMAGWWLWGIACWIGGGWCSGTGGWTADDDGRLYRQARNPGREPGVKRERPHLTNNGQGVNAPQMREPGVARQLPHLGNDGMGVNAPQMREPGVEYHDVVMPKLVRWLRLLSARLRHVRIVNGDWKRVVTSGAAETLPVRSGGHVGIFLDPPYAASADRAADLYGAHDDLDVAHDVAAWCAAHGDDPRYRIVLAGFEGEHDATLTDAGWREVEWFAAGWLSGGMGNVGADDHQQARERLWCSPACLRPDDQLSLWGEP